MYTSRPSCYNTSTTLSNLPWDTYDYCNSGARLRCVIVVMRHHKRTPDNLHLSERTLNPITGWNCSSIIPHNRIWAGTCDSGQLTREGLDDAIKHGRVRWGVYHERLRFLEHVSEKEIYVRTSTEPRTQQVAGAMLYGMDPNTASKQWPMYIQPDIIDPLVPNYACPVAGQLRAEAQAMSLDETLGTTGLDAWNSWYDRFFDTFTSRTCHGHSLPCNVTGAYVSQEDAKMVYLFNDGLQASQYVKLALQILCGTCPTGTLLTTEVRRT
ncbi:histidine phosphatase superfamily [Pisolithus tinctorius]|nr:histidine phosphatase superfamily [Pisolithus tinctorius]